VSLLLLAGAWSSAGHSVGRQSPQGQGVAAQDPRIVEPIVASAEGRLRFARLDYRPVGADAVHTVEARDLRQIWMLVRPDGGTILEIYFENDDYKLAQVNEVLFRHRAEGATQREVPVFRRAIGGIAFPAMR
jgi:hypothetical protein